MDSYNIKMPNINIIQYSHMCSSSIKHMRCMINAMAELQVSEKFLDKPLLNLLIYQENCFPEDVNDGSHSLLYLPSECVNFSVYWQHVYIDSGCWYCEQIVDSPRL